MYLYQGIIDSTGETRQIFSRMFVIATCFEFKELFTPA